MGGAFSLGLGPRMSQRGKHGNSAFETRRRQELDRSQTMELLVEGR
jgi:hypothetical protein